MIKRSLLWVLAAYCIGIVFRDRLKWILWAVLFSYFLFVYEWWGKEAVIRLRGLWGNWNIKRNAGIYRQGYSRILQYWKMGVGMQPCMGALELWKRKKDAVQRFIQREKFFLAVLPLILLLGATLGRLQAADYPIDAVLTEKTVASAEGRIRAIAQTKSGYRLELNHIRIYLSDSEKKQYAMYSSENITEVGWDDTESGNLSADSSEQKIYTKGKLLVYCESAEGLKIGNYIRLSGKVVPFAEPENAGQFDEWAYYRAERMCCKFNADEIEVLNDGVDEIREWCRVIRNRMDTIYEEILPKKHAGIVSAILLGDKAELDADTKALYQKNGIAHILAISGLHVSLLGMGVFALIRKCGSPLVPAAVTTMLILIFYGCLTEFSVSTQRAVGMLVIAMFAKLLGRSYDSRSACALCGLFILIVNPMQLYQAGFQLSFAAAFGISYFGRELEMMKLNKGKKLSERMMVSLLSGMTTQLLTVPIILNCFYELPVYAVLLNLPVIGLLSAVVLLSILAGGAGIFSYSFGKFLAGGVYIILEFYESLCGLVEKLPCPIWLYGKPQGWRIFAYFAVLLLFFAIAAKVGKRYRHHPRQHRYRRWAFWVLCLLPLVLAKCPDRIGEEDSEPLWVKNTVGPEEERRKGDSCIVSLLSVGQGDCAVVQSGNGSTYLIDCGSSSVKLVGEYRLKPWLKYHGISKLEAVFLSHPDSDHTNGVMELLEKTNSPDDWYRGEIQIKNLVLPAAYRKEVEAAAADNRKSNEHSAERFVERIDEDGQSEEKGFASIYKLAQKNGIPVLWFDTGDKVTEAGLSFTCLHPNEEYPTYDTNDASMVLMMECQNIGILFTGDVGEAGEEKVGLALGEMLEKEEEMGVLEEVIAGNKNNSSGIWSETGENKTVILKVAHHGSKNSTSEAFLKILQPDIAVISCGKNNRFGHPHEDTLERLKKVGSKVVATPESGTVSVRIGKEKTTLAGYK